MSEEKEPEVNLLLAEIPSVTWDDIAGQDDARIDKLPALDARHHAHDRIVIGAKIAHESPPVRTRRMIAGVQ